MNCFICSYRPATTRTPRRNIPACEPCAQRARDMLALLDGRVTPKPLTPIQRAKERHPAGKSRPYRWRNVLAPTTEGWNGG